MRYLPIANTAAIAIAIAFYQSGAAGRGEDVRRLTRAQAGGHMNALVVVMAIAHQRIRRHRSFVLKNLSTRPIARA